MLWDPLWGLGSILQSGGLCPAWASAVHPSHTDKCGDLGTCRGMVLRQTPAHRQGLPALQVVHPPQTAGSLGSLVSDFLDSAVPSRPWLCHWGEGGGAGLGRGRVALVGMFKKHEPKLPLGCSFGLLCASCQVAPCAESQV